MRRMMVAASRGYTMVEIVITLGVISMLAVAATPYYADYMANSRLRESGNVLLGEALYAQSEAIKRNTQIGLKMPGGTGNLQVLDVANGNAVLRQKKIPDGVTASTTDVNVIFGGQGRPVPFGTAVTINLGLDKFTCSSSIRCTGLRVDGGGGMRLCKNIQDC